MQEEFLTIMSTPKIEVSLEKVACEDFLNLKEIIKAVSIALRDHRGDITTTAVRAAMAMPAEASDFDRGLAAGFLIATLLPARS